MRSMRRYRPSVVCFSPGRACAGAAGAPPGATAGATTDGARTRGRLRGSMRSGRGRKVTNSSGTTSSAAAPHTRALRSRPAMAAARVSSPGCVPTHRDSSGPRVTLAEAQAGSPGSAGAAPRAAANSASSLPTWPSGRLPSTTTIEQRARSASTASSWSSMARASTSTGAGREADGISWPATRWARAIPGRIADTGAPPPARTRAITSPKGTPRMPGWTYAMLVSV